jgi:hypothetical protein
MAAALVAELWNAARRADGLADVRVRVPPPSALQPALARPPPPTTRQRLIEERGVPVDALSKRVLPEQLRSSTHTRHAPPPSLSPGRHETALRAAAFCGRGDTLAFLLSRGANPNAVHPRTGVTALHLAVLWGHADVITALLAAGADPHVRATNDGFLFPWNGKTPMDVAVMAPSTEAGEGAGNPQVGTSTAAGVPARWVGTTGGEGLPACWVGTTGGEGLPACWVGTETRTRTRTPPPPHCRWTSRRWATTACRCGPAS